MTEFNIYSLTVLSIWQIIWQVLKTGLYKFNSRENEGEVQVENSPFPLQIFFELASGSS